MRKVKCPYCRRHFAPKSLKLHIRAVHPREYFRTALNAACEALLERKVASINALRRAVAEKGGCSSPDFIWRVVSYLEEKGYARTWTYKGRTWVYPTKSLIELNQSE